MSSYMSFEWHLRKLLILKRDGFKCVKCGYEGYLHVHHKVYKNGFEVWEYTDEYLETLCKTCHEKAHDEKPIGDFYVRDKEVQKYKFPHELIVQFDTTVSVIDGIKVDIGRLRRGGLTEFEIGKFILMCKMPKGESGVLMNGERIYTADTIARDI